MYFNQKKNRSPIARAARFFSHGMFWEQLPHHPSKILNSMPVKIMFENMKMSKLCHFVKFLAYNSKNIKKIYLNSD